MWVACVLFAAVAVPVTPASGPVSLQVASERPLDIDFASDPILGLKRRQVDRDEFQRVIETALRRHPALEENAALEDEAAVRVDQEKAGYFPTVDLNVSSYRVLSREFSNDPNNIIERSRAKQRTDAQLSVQQTVLDFGATARRVGAARSREAAAAADLEGTADRIALGVIDAWYNVFGYRALVSVGTSFLHAQRDLRAGIEQRIREGASAEGDLARVDSYLSEAAQRLATYERQLGEAEARYRELTGDFPTVVTSRAPVPVLSMRSREDAIYAADATAGVRSAQSAADAAIRDASAIKAAKLPSVSAGVDAGRYGVLENTSDYDVRARVTLKHRLYGGTEPRTAQYEARARSAGARASRIRQEAERDAAIAFSDVQTLERQLDALQEAYKASRRSRDVIVSRFRSSRGSLIDVLGAEDAYFSSATAYVQGLIQLDSARYVLLSRTGMLLGELKIDTESLESKR